MKKILSVITTLLIILTLISCSRVNPASDFIYGLTDDGEGVIIREYVGKSYKINIPKEIEGIPVVKVGNEKEVSFISAAEKVSELMQSKITEEEFIEWAEKSPSYKLNIPSSVKEIGFLGGFYKGGFPKLIINVKTENLTSIASYGFKDQTILEPIVISKDCKIGKFAFQNSKIENVIFQEGVTQIGEVEKIIEEYGSPWYNVGNNYIFSGSTIKSLTLPSTLTEINGNQFEYCKNLTNVVIPDNMKIKYLSLYMGDEKPSECFFGCALTIESQQKIKSTGYTGPF